MMGVAGPLHHRLKGLDLSPLQRFKFQQQQHADSKNCLSSSCCYLNFCNTLVTVTQNVSPNFFFPVVFHHAVDHEVFHCTFLDRSIPRADKMKSIFDMLSGATIRVTDPVVGG